MFIVTFSNNQVIVNTLIELISLIRVHQCRIEGELIDIGVVELKEIAADEGDPVMGEDSDEMILHDGDVNIQPPSS